jgi:hypothetical protein
VDGVDPLQMLFEGRDGDVRHHRDAVFGPFAIANDDLALGEVEVFDPQPHTFHQAQAAAVEQLGHQLVRTRQHADDGAGLLSGQNSGQPLGGAWRGRR